MVELVIEENARQVQMWQNFYEKAWEARATFMRDMIRNGESDPFRIVSLALQRERMYELSVSNGQVQWAERQFDEETLPSGTPILKNTSFRGNPVNIPFYAYYDFRDLVIDYAQKHGPFDCILELGCGYGQNLFGIYAKGGPNIPYFGGEFTESGVKIARELASLAPNRNYDFFHFNHLKPDLSNLPKQRKALVFTCHTIEQVLEIPNNWFDIVAGFADEVHCIHMEPFGFQMQELGPITRLHAEFFSRTGWNHNMAAVARDADERGVIKVESIALETTFSTDPVNPSSLLFWRTP